MNNFNLTNSVTEPTKQKNALLDPVLVSDEVTCIFAEVINNRRSISFHEAKYITITIPFKLNYSYLAELWLYKQADFHRVNEAIENYHWDTFFKDVNEMTKSFTNKYIEFLTKLLL